MKKLEELTVLVVDDSVTIRKIITTNLQKLGITKIFQAKSGDEGYGSAKTNKIDIILTDHNMAGMNGLDMVTRLRNDPKTESIFIIAVSSEFDAKLKDEYGRLGVFQFIHKPFNQTGFNNALLAYLKSEDKNGAEWEKPTPSKLKELLKNGDFAVSCQGQNLEFDFGTQKLVIELKDIADKAKLYNMIELKD
jgi:CheY-like chemotaxis protein